MTVVFYFTGTGNSRYAARRIAEALGDSLYSINEAVKAGDTLTSGEERLVFALPTYAWRIPKIAEHWIRSARFPQGARVWFVMTCGSSICGAPRYNRLLCGEKKLRYMGTVGIVMPENYIAMFNAPDEEKAKRIIAKADPLIGRAAELIGRGEAFPAARNNLYDRLMSSVVTPLFYRSSVKAKLFYTKESCTGCGRCVKLCPLNNISLQNGRPVWGENCTHCMACICRCPAEAIEYGRRSVGKPRYHLD